MSFSEEAKRELAELSRSDSLRQDMRIVAAGRHNPFKLGGNAEEYIEFVTQYNEFINHVPKPFKPIADRTMVL
ncbi:MAG: hypothetical protein HYU64_17785 [Armatimonadetes bacterium]|nr:hypothetical protein [Armatimonadota bacterium]